MSRERGKAPSPTAARGRSVSGRARPSGKVMHGDRRDIPPAAGSGKPIRIALSAGVAASFLAAQVGPSNWLWGINLLRYYPRPFGIVWTAAALLAIWLLPPARRPSAAPVADAPHRGLAFPPAAVAGLAGAVAVVIFMAFRAESLLLGDGMEIIRRLHQGNVPTPRSPLFNVIEPLLFRWLSHGDMGREARAAGALSIVAGVVAVTVGAFHLARIGTRNREGAIAAGVLLYLTGAVQLFFGYVEAYPLLGAATLVFYVAAFDRLSAADRLPGSRSAAPRGGGGSGTWVATAALLVAVAAHPFGATLVPGWLYLISLKERDGELAIDRRRVFHGTATGLALVIVLFALFALRPELRRVGGTFRFVAPQELWHGMTEALATLGGPRPWADKYRIFSLVHLADSWNTLWLVGAAACCAIAGIVAVRPWRAAILPGREAIRPGGTSIEPGRTAIPPGGTAIGPGRTAIPPPVILAVVSLIGMVVVRALFRTPLGAMRDWDLFSGLGLGVAGLAAALVLVTPARFFWRPIAAAALFFVVPWIGIQTSNDRAALRHFDGLEASPRPEPAVAGYFHCVMADRFANLRRYDLAVRAYDRALAVYPRYDFAWRLGTIQMMSKNYGEAARAFSRALDLNPGDEPASILLAEALMGQGDLAQAAGVLDHVLAADPGSGTAHLRYAQIETARGRTREAADHLEIAGRDIPVDQAAARRELEEVRRQLQAARASGQ